MSLPLILTPTKDASAKKKRSWFSCSTQPRTPTKKSAAHGAAPGTILSTSTITEATSTTSSLSQTGKLLQQRKSVAEGCDAPLCPPIVIYGRDIHLDKKSHGNQTLLKLIRLNLISYREAQNDVRAVLVRKIIQQMRDWRGRFVKFNKDNNAWKDLPSKDAIDLVRGTFDEEVLKRRGRFVKFNKDTNAWKDLPSNYAISFVRATFEEEEVLKRRGDIDAAVQSFPPEETAIQSFLPEETAIQSFLPKEIEGKGMDQDQIEAYFQFTPVQQAKFLKLCQLRAYEVEDVLEAVNLIEIPPWTHTTVVSPIAAVSSETLQIENEGELKRPETCSWVDELMLATQDKEEAFLSRSMTFDDNTPLPDPISARRNLGADDAGLTESDGQQVLVRQAKFRKLCKLHVDDIEDAVTLIEVIPWTHTAVVSPITAVSPETLQNENEGESKRRKKSRKKAVHIPVRQDAHEVWYESSGDRRLRTEPCSWVDTLMLATPDSEELLLPRSTVYDDNTPLPDPISARRHLWGEGAGLTESDSSQVPVPEMDFNLYESPFLW